MGLLWQGALHHCVFKLQCSHMLFCKCTAFSCCIHNIFILQVCKVRMGPSSYFLAGDVVKDNIILIAYANSGAQAAVVINRHEWDASKQVMIQTRLPGDTRLTIESFRCNGCREQGWELVSMDPSHEMSDLCLLAKQAFETYLTEQWIPWLTMSCSHISDHFEHGVVIDVGTWMGPCSRTYMC